MPVQLNRFVEDAAEDAKFQEGIRNRDQASMMAIYDRYSDLIFAVALRVLQRPDEAEDAMHDILLKLWRGSVSFVSGRGPLGVRLIVITRKHAIDLAAKRGFSESIEGFVLPSSTNLVHQAQPGFEVVKTEDIAAKLPISQQGP